MLSLKTVYPTLCATVLNTYIYPSSHEPNAKRCAPSCREGKPRSLLDLPQELLERTVRLLPREDQRSKRAARSVSRRFRQAVNWNVEQLKVDSSLEGKAIPEALLPRLRTISLDVSNGRREGLWSPECLRALGIERAPDSCTLRVTAEAAILDIARLSASLADAGLMPRVRELSQACWALEGPPAPFAGHVQVHARLKLVLWSGWTDRSCLKAGLLTA